jgi:hypothetical protein
VALGLLPGRLANLRESPISSAPPDSRSQQYPDIRRALRAESVAARGTLDLVELDVYSLAPAANDVRVLDAAALTDLTAALEPATVRAGTIDGLRFLPHRVLWQELMYEYLLLGKPPKTLEQLLHVARRYPGKIGFKAARYEGLSCDVLPFVWAAGGDGVLVRRSARTQRSRSSTTSLLREPAERGFKESTIVEAMARGRSCCT